jgi:hypothetical protein
MSLTEEVQKLWTCEAVVQATTEVGVPSLTPLSCLGSSTF